MTSETTNLLTLGLHICGTKYKDKSPGYLFHSITYDLGVVQFLCKQGYEQMLKTFRKKDTGPV